MKAIDFSKPVTYSILNAMLERESFTQLALSREKKVSLGQVNKVAKYLAEKRLIEKDSGNYYLNNAFGAIECIAATRKMKNNLHLKINLAMEKENALNLLGKKAVLCLDSALEQFSPNISSTRVCAYLPEGLKTPLLKELQEHTGGGVELWLYKSDLSLETEQANGKTCTSKKRTVIDMVCDNSAFAAKELFLELWGQRIL